MKMKEFNLSQQAAGDLWADIQAFFVETFNEQKKVEEIKRSAGKLKEDLEARFGNKYKAEPIVKLLENGFQQIDGMFLFKRADFFPQVQHHVIEEVKA